MKEVRTRSPRGEKGKEALREEGLLLEREEEAGPESEQKLGRALRILAPGTAFRDGIDNILRGKMGALIVVGDSPAVLEISEGGFFINCDFTAANLYELAKMDGAIILSRDTQRILYANTQLIPNPDIPSRETGIRHRTAERVARQTGELVLAISQRRGLISLFQGSMKYLLQDIGLLLVKANQALQTLEKHRLVLDKDLLNLSALEFEDLVTVFEVARVLQRIELVTRIVREIREYINELGIEGRLVNMQLQELMGNIEEEALRIVQDYNARPNEKSPSEIIHQLSRWSAEDLTDLVAIARVLGYGATPGVLDLPISPKGYRILQRIPRLPLPVIENLINAMGDLPRILKASIDELDDVEGIGEVRARAIKSGLKRLQEQVILDQRL
ncbi:MAG: DNA integrity scanning diadenylate cyclase DisA [Syntrophomonadaceae bacterium]|nr:DNA integrity scanning diadenylate cyclase DisA [Syntrophomonadaceae bacterium]